jgi:hypothetical protein
VAVGRSATRQRMVQVVNVVLVGRTSDPRIVLAKASSSLPTIELVLFTLAVTRTICCLGLFSTQWWLFRTLVGQRCTTAEGAVTDFEVEEDALSKRRMLSAVIQYRISTCLKSLSILRE